MKATELIKKIQELERRIEKLERGEKPYESPEKINPYDLSCIQRLRNEHTGPKKHP